MPFGRVVRVWVAGQGLRGENVRGVEIDVIQDKPVNDPEDAGDHLVQGSGFRVRGSGFRVRGSGFRVQGSGFRVQGSGFRVWGSGCAGLLSQTRFEDSFLEPG